MPTSTPRRLLVFGLSMLLFGSGFVQAGDHDCETTKKVRLPRQTVELQVSQPSVSVRERAYRGTPVIGTLYMPMAFPFTSSSRDIDSDPFAKAHEAMRLQDHADLARARFKAEVEQTQRVLSRMGTSADNKDGPKGAEIESRLKAIDEKLEKMNDRLTAVEKLILIHDNYLLQEKDKKPRSAELINPPKDFMPQIPPATDPKLNMKYDPLIPPPTK